MAQFAGDPAALRRELSRRVRERMSDRADAGMAADPVRCMGMGAGVQSVCKLASSVLAHKVQSHDLHLASAPQVQLAMPGYRGRFYTKCFDAPAPSGPELEQLVRTRDGFGGPLC